MTSNQLRYWDLERQKAQDQRTAHINAQNAASQRMQVLELQRHQKATEQEQHRANLAQEAINRYNSALAAQRNKTDLLNYQESVRANKARESYNLRNLLETTRSNKAREAETYRANNMAATNTVIGSILNAAGTIFRTGVESGTKWRTTKLLANNRRK